MKRILLSVLFVLLVSSPLPAAEVFLGALEGETTVTPEGEMALVPLFVLFEAHPTAVIITKSISGESFYCRLPEEKTLIRMGGSYLLNCEWVKDEAEISLPAPPAFANVLLALPAPVENTSLRVCARAAEEVCREILLLPAVKKEVSDNSSSSERSSTGEDDNLSSTSDSAPDQEATSHNFSGNTLLEAIRANRKSGSTGKVWNGNEDIVETSTSRPQPSSNTSPTYWTGEVPASETGASSSSQEPAPADTGSSDDSSSNVSPVSSNVPSTPVTDEHASVVVPGAMYLPAGSPPDFPDTLYYTVNVPARSAKHVYFYGCSGDLSNPLDLYIGESSYYHSGAVVAVARFVGDREPAEDDFPTWEDYETLYDYVFSRMVNPCPKDYVYDWSSWYGKINPDYQDVYYCLSTVLTKHLEIFGEEQKCGWWAVTLFNVSDVSRQGVSLLLNLPRQ